MRESEVASEFLLLVIESKGSNPGNRAESEAQTYTLNQATSNLSVDSIDVGAISASDTDHGNQKFFLDSEKSNSKYQGGGSQTSGKASPPAFCHSDTPQSAACCQTHPEHPRPA
jgi:hypothetical protein